VGRLDRHRIERICGGEASYSSVAGGELSSQVQPLESIMRRIPHLVGSSVPGHRGDLLIWRELDSLRLSKC
jgi:hypothetical protein